MSEVMPSTDGSQRANLISKINTPLHFFSLLMIIVETITTTAMGLIKDVDGSIILYINAAFIALVFISVLLLARFQPEALYGIRYIPPRYKDLKAENLRVKEELDLLKSESEAKINNLSMENQMISNKLARMLPLKKQVYGLLASTEKFTLDGITSNITPSDKKSLRNEVLTVLGELSEEGKIHGTPLGYYEIIKPK